MAWNKYDPKPDEPVGGLGASTPSANRRALFLRWATWISLGMTVLGYALIVYWIL